MNKISSIKYKDFSLSLHRDNMTTGIPVRGHMEVTFGCNLNCVHCYTACYNKNKYIKNELAYSEICGILDQVMEAGCLWLTFTGGEPFFRKDFLDIYSYAKKK